MRASNATDFEAIVIGAGPGGIATMCGLLDGGLERILWVDRDFIGGSLNSLYREISSNTKSGIYLSALESSKTCRRIIDTKPQPNPVTELEQLDKDKTCQLSLAGDMIQMIKDGILMEYAGVKRFQEEVERATLNGSIWTVFTGDGSHTTPRLYLCTGSYPSQPSLHKPFNPNLKVLDLDKCMIRSSLPSLFPRNQQSTVAVIGNSHSGILVCRNLYEIAQGKQRDLQILNFRRRPIKIAEYTEDGIVWDNTGLKGATADWAQEHMVDGDKAGGHILRQIDLKPDEDAIYTEYLPKSTHIIYAIGYQRSPLPPLVIDGKDRSNHIEFDMHSSGFHLPSDPSDEKTEEGQRVRGLYGLGIAFPELVEDPEGHVEAAVGVAKFFKFAERVKDDWVAIR